MRKSWLVQRLTEPINAEHPLFGKDNPFAFGGGKRNGGLSDEAMSLLRPLFGFDYMGAAEFEFGAVPKALNAMAKAAPVRLVEVKVAGGTLWAVVPGDLNRDDVAIRVQDLANGDHKDREHASYSIRRTLNGDDSRAIVGWLELDNGFAFFTTEERASRFCGLLNGDEEAYAAAAAPAAGEVERHGD